MPTSLLINEFGGIFEANQNDWFPPCILGVYAILFCISIYPSGRFARQPQTHSTIFRREKQEQGKIIFL
jgi:hypothetical protein